MWILSWKSNNAVLDVTVFTNIIGKFNIITRILEKCTKTHRVKGWKREYDESIHLQHCRPLVNIRVIRLTLKRPFSKFVLIRRLWRQAKALFVKRARHESRHGRASKQQANLELCVCLGKVCWVFSNSLECIRLSRVLLMVGAGQTGYHGNSSIRWESVACILHYKEDTLNEKNRGMKHWCMSPNWMSILYMWLCDQNNTWLTTFLFNVVG